MTIDLQQSEKGKNHKRWLLFGTTCPEGRKCTFTSNEFIWNPRSIFQRVMSGERSYTNLQEERQTNLSLTPQRNTRYSGVLSIIRTEHFIIILTYGEWGWRWYTFFHTITDRYFHLSFILHHITYV